MIANDEDTLVFIDVTATEYGEGGFEGGKVKRGDLEIAAASWLAGNTPDGDIQVRFDIIDMLVVSADRALLRTTSTPSAAGSSNRPPSRPPLEGREPLGVITRGSSASLSAVPHDLLVDRERRGA